MTAPTDAQDLVRRVAWLEGLFALEPDEAIRTAPNDPVTAGKCVMSLEFFEDRQCRIREAAATISRLQAENGKMRAALKPFAAVAKHYDGNVIGLGRVEDHHVEVPFSLAYIRRARAALTQSGADAMEGG